jgi:hypothetical protein
MEEYTAAEYPADRADPMDGGSPCHSLTASQSHSPEPRGQTCVYLPVGRIREPIRRNAVCRGAALLRRVAAAFVALQCGSQIQPGESPLLWAIN